ncbi:MAG: recombination protein RecR [Planctomycetes bacterium]|nr:recombination protein RecR [Planctomycetota bacterium]
MQTEPIQNLIQELSKLPGIGEKTAERLAFHLLSRQKDEVLRLADALRDLKEQVKSCGSCYNTSDQDPCAICSDPKRDRTVVCVVEQMQDLWAIEKSGSYRGLYHVLHGRLAPLDGVGPEHLTISKLVDRVRKGDVAEVILATNPTMEGDATAYYLRSALAAPNLRVTRIARGVPAGGSLEYSNRTIVADALQGRREL